MELYSYVLKVLASLILVIGAVVLILPIVLRKFSGLKVIGGKGSFEIKKVSPISRNVFVVELDIKGRTYVLVVGEKGADVIYREDDKGPSPDASDKYDRSGTGEDTTSDRAQSR